MNYAELKDEIKELATIADSVPEQFREKCFEILLSHLLKGQKNRQQDVSGDEDADGTEEQDAADKDNDGKKSGSQAIPAQVRVFMRRTSVTELELCAVLMIEDGDVHFIREPKATKVARGQIEWALLLALKNGYLKNEMSVDPEDVRSMCQDKGFYDKANFATNFKGAKVQPLFKGLMKPQGGAQGLTNEGQTELGKLIKSLAAQVN